MLVTAVAPSGPRITVTAVSSPAQHLARLAGGSRAERLLHVEEVPARPARLAEWPAGVDPAVLAALLGAGVERPWSHQREAIDLATAGQHVVLATGTASGRASGYLVPVLGAVARGRERGLCAGPPPSTSRRPRRWPPTSSRGSTPSPSPACAPPPTTGTRPRTSGAGCASTRTSCSPTRTCSTTRSCPGHAALVAVPARAGVRRGRRVPRLPGRLRRARVRRAAPAAARRGALRRDAHGGPRVGDGERPRRRTPPGSPVCRSAR